MHAISSYRGNRPTNTPTNNARLPQTGPITIHCAVKLSTQCNNHANLKNVTDSGVFPPKSSGFTVALWLGPIQSIVQWPLQWKLLIKSYDTDFTLSVFTRWMNLLLHWMLVTSDNRKWFKFLHCQ